MKRARRFTDEHFNSNAQRAVESRRRGDRLQLSIRRKTNRTTFRCNCGYSTSKAGWLEECPMCGIRFANGPTAPIERSRRTA